MKNLKNKYASLLAVPVALSTYAATTGTAEAQRERPSREERRDTRRQQIDQMTPEQREQYFRTRRQEWERNMTPEQRQRMLERRQERERQMREGGGQPGQGGQGGWGNGGGWGGDAGGEQQEVDVMANAGITDPTVKDAIHAFVAAQQEARKPLLEMARNITADLGKPEVTGEQIATRMKAFRDALVVDQKRYDAALVELDAKIGYTKNPKLEAFLTMAGVLGYEAPQVGGAIAIFDNLTPPPAPAAALPVNPTPGAAPPAAVPPDDAPPAGAAPVAGEAPAAGAAPAN